MYSGATVSFRSKLLRPNFVLKGNCHRIQTAFNKDRLSFLALPSVKLLFHQLTRIPSCQVLHLCAFWPNENELSRFSQNRSEISTVWGRGFDLPFYVFGEMCTYCNHPCTSRTEKRTFQREWGAGVGNQIRRILMKLFFLFQPLTPKWTALNTRFKESVTLSFFMAWRVTVQ